jgi:deoxyxylulose-5-phosphate synthase
MDASRLILKPTLGPSLGMGKGQIIRQGKELALVALGTATEMALKVADQLHKSGHEAAVVEIPWARPLDEPLLGAVAHHFRRIVTIENGALNGGFGASILELLESKDWQQVEVHRVGLNREGTDNPVKISQDIGRFLERANQSQLIKLPLSLQPKNHQA